MEHLLVREAYTVQSFCVDLLALERSVQSAESSLAYFKEEKARLEQLLAKEGFTLLVNREKPLESMLVRIEQPSKVQEPGTVAVYLPKKDSTQ